MNPLAFLKHRSGVVAPAAPVEPTKADPAPVRNYAAERNARAAALVKPAADAAARRYAAEGIGA